MIRIILIAGGLTLPMSAATAPAPEALAFDRFIVASAPVCMQQRAQACVDAGFAFADANGDGKLSLAELQAVRAKFGSWIAWRGPDLSPHERGAALFGAQMIDAIGLDRLIAAYDENGDGKISKRELLADLRLDDRPLGDVLMDEKAVDRASLQRRLGPLAMAVEGVLRQPR